MIVAFGWGLSSQALGLCVCTAESSSLRQADEGHRLRPPTA
jgi:hypothetical protein